ncbi:hypothetical protein GH714_030380 [Hevea brasiliensis]|uniref:Retrovirus-related Pol polyprotein from transposon TNT 1-94-like beta-barrel domain-containing protein n=1 Tax=Hevea brasiliensis TaxID=3981 RepID=A0A6A6KBC2_HEVBR|nr:hypothetical protein GH714_030302 [Hevea brasiliensis]KAF2284786.1 hypothetical protein GH714_030380 [Hevea brasiliensis]
MKDLLFVMILHLSVFSTTDPKGKIDEEWTFEYEVIDSGATINAISRKEFFSSYTLRDYGVIKMGNDNLSKVISKGDVCLMMENGMVLFLRDGRHISNMRLNLISTSRLDDEDFCNTFMNGKWKITKGSLVVARGIK